MKVLSLCACLWTFTSCLQAFDTAGDSLSPYFDRDTTGLAEAKPMTALEFSDGQSFRLEAAPAKKRLGQVTTRLLTYNGQFPGPVLKVKQGSHLFVTVVNRTGSPTTLHPHGLRLDYRFDGVPGISQDPIAPGDSFTYRLDFPDPGLYWYHPHVRTDYQSDMGLYGAILVSPKDSNYWGGQVDREEVLIVDDMLLDSGGIAPYNQLEADHALMGRYGNTFLINGQTDFSLSTWKKERIRFYILNAASTRVFNLSLANTLMRLVGSDYGRAYKAEFSETVLIAPAERYVVETYIQEVGNRPIYHRNPTRYNTTGPYFESGGKLFPPPPETYPLIGQLLVSSDTLPSPHGATFFVPTDTNATQGEFWTTRFSTLDSIVQSIPDFFMELSLAMDHKKLPMDLFPDPVTDTTDLNDSAFALAFRAAQGPGGSPESSPLFIPYSPRDTSGQPIMPGHVGEVTPLGVRRSMAASMLAPMGLSLAKQTHNDPSGVGIEWFDDMPEMNRRSTSDNVRWIMRDYRTGKENMDLHWHFKKGKVYHIRIWNNYNVMHPMAHVIHFHGQRTVQLANNGFIEKNPMWKDTFLIGKGKTVDLLLEASNPGMWMGHCHIAEHAEASMMFMFQVDP